MTALQSAIGDYQFVARIGEGGMGAVYCAVHQSLGNEVAIKVLPTALASDETARQWFRRGAASAAALQHPNILPVFYYGEHDGAPYLVMPYIKGGTLKDRMLAGPLSQDEVIGYLRQLAAALDCAHEQGIVHRDVKPANLLLDERGHLYLADFGIARALESATRFTRTGTAVGTPEYMAPEQARGQADQRSDLYAVGIILYQLLTGQVPFTGDSAVEILMKHLQEPLPVAPLRERQPAVPPALERVLQRALAKDPDARYGRATALVADVEAALAGAPLQSGPTAVGAPPAADFDATAIARSAPTANFAPGTRNQIPPTPPPHAPQQTPLGPTPTPYAPAPTPQPQSPHHHAPTPHPLTRVPDPHTPTPPPSPNLLVIALSAALILSLLFGSSYFAWNQFLRDPETATVAKTLPEPSPSVVAQTSPSPQASPSPMPSPSPSPKPSPSPSASPTAVVSRDPAGAKPEGWLTFSGSASTPFAIYYPPDWTVDRSSESQGSILFWAPGKTASIRIASIGKAQPGSHLDQLRDQQLDAEIDYCIKNNCKVGSVSETGYDTLNPRFAWFLTTVTYANGNVADLRDGIALKGDVMWVYNVVVSHNDQNDTGTIMRTMMPSLNIYANP